MAKRSINTLKLGTFVIAGLGFLVMLLYVIGKNQNVFGNTFMLKARFENVHGLMPGNSIRFGGIDAGSVKKIEVLNDTTIEVTLLVKSKMKNYIHKNATVNIITDGLIGNKLINIQPVKAKAPVVEEGDILYSTKALDTEEMLAVLNTTNNDIAVIAKELKQIVTRINESKVIWGILEDESLPASIRQSLYRVKTASASMATMM
ncbi:MAG TPA: MlaD family protein, partial [Flavisolibacter sp.]|nr:MlaD family protein [Flavisolibacter sp.]